MIYLIYLLLFILGLAVGSFLNVLALRYRPNRSVFSFKHTPYRSRCLHCRKKLLWFELVPLVSFLIQKGRCRGCNEKLTVQYPLVELISGIIFLAVPLYLQRFYEIFQIFPLREELRAFYGIALIWIVVFLIWLLIGVIDIRHYLIPNELNAILVLLGLLTTTVKSVPHIWLLPFRDTFLRHYGLLFSPFQNIWFKSLFGALIGLIFFGALVVLSRGKAMGLGDVKLALANGLILGWPDIGLTIAIAFVIGGVYGASLIVFKKKTLHSRLPFAPFLVLGSTITVFFGYQIVQGYLGLFNI